MKAVIPHLSFPSTDSEAWLLGLRLEDRIAGRRLVVKDGRLALLLDVETQAKAVARARAPPPQRRRPR
jgi:hypothetical protein